jgi:hypothetical protein
MASSRERLAALGTAIPDILLPSGGIDLGAWAVVACDQFTQDRAYWKRVEDRVASSPSMLRMILPEVFLEDGDRSVRLAAIRNAMASYRTEGVFAEPVHGAMYIERATPHHGRRRGLVLAIDLERYEWAPTSRPLIRATEGTVRERIPPRMEIRRGAPIESPHVLLLIDDDERSLIEGLGDRARSRTPAYDTPLMLGAGSIRGWVLDREEDWSYLADGLERLARRAADRYLGDNEPISGDPFLYAVGDGNHSLATAKAVWEEYKAAHATDASIMDHPSRWALVEVENLYDEGIEFEPIHRVVFSTTPAELASALAGLPGFSATKVSDTATLARLVGEEGIGHTRYGLVARDACILIETGAMGLATEPLQPILDAFVAADHSRSIDYLHGADETIRVALTSSSNAGILLPPVGKSDLFSTVARSGPLPRKSFSMGEAIEKRFYLECRSLFR